jgi:REP element-mobilizing transposase RayT
LIVGGFEDHLHVLLSLPATLCVAKAVQLLKGNSSKWVHDTFKDLWDFEWQEGYGAFSIGVSGVKETTKYINNQQLHHRKTSFEGELEMFLKKHGMQYVRQDLE